MTRVSITIEVNCDPVPGSFNEPEDWKRHFEYHCNSRFPWYKPQITDFHVLDKEEKTQ